MHKKLNDYIDALDVSQVTESRKQVLKVLTDFIQSKVGAEQPIHLNFICTHNSRRSHLGQVWSTAMASYFNIPEVLTYSGGTETTAVFPMIIDTLEYQGFEVESLDDTDNPIYSVGYAEEEALYLFSKKYDDESNPESDFAAIMTCSQADENCPFIAGAEKRIAITYEDPKIADGRDDQQKVYLERSAQIATEMKYVFSKVTV
ncbi:low molecular weight phosphatase family protein [Nonlabens marinus]|uniref:Arsenate reductase n=1 Tax=Nonlabens marinus S1-08 TaxID=1454201 RepID=W8VWK7_9FLAO|nr:protein-tyrosine-phosphatase [Nonlabens marinus]BAO54822.1 arsenate reductase [Nonlabens marinus S1-08]